MKKHKKLLIALLVVCLLLPAGFWLKKQIAMDTCLDRGGRWDYENNVCEPSPF